MSVVVHLREARFFAIKHSLVTIFSMVLIKIGTVKIKRKSTSQLKTKTTCVWFGIALLTIILNIPWEFSPLVNRPSFR